MYIKISNFTLKYNGVAILENSEFLAKQGELIILRGESGSGKTALLDVLSFHNTESEITFSEFKFLDYDILNMNSKARNIIKKQVGYILQKPNFIESLTVKQNFELIFKFENHKELDDQKILEIFNKVGLSNVNYKYPNQLSGGELQRLDIARIILQDPLVVLADEITSALDLENKYKIIQLLTELARQGKIIIFVTHEDFIDNYGDAFYFIKDKKIMNYRPKNITIPENIYETRGKNVKSYRKTRFSFYKKTHINILQMKMMKKIFLSTVLLIFCFCVLNIGVVYQKNQINSYNEKFSRHLLVESMKSISTARTSIQFSDEDNALGFTKDDVENIKKISGVESVKPIIKGGISNVKIENKTLKEDNVISSIPLLTTRFLKKGTAEITASIAEMLNLNIGDVVKFETTFLEGHSTDSNELSHYLHHQEFEVRISKINNYNTVFGLSQQAVLISEDELDGNIKNINPTYLDVICEDTLSFLQIEQEIRKILPTINIFYNDTAIQLHRNDELTSRILNILGIATIILIVIYQFYKNIKALEKRSSREFAVLQIWGIDRIDIQKMVLIESCVSFMASLLCFLCISVLMIQVIQCQLNNYDYNYYHSVIAIFLLTILHEILIKGIALNLFLKHNVLRLLRSIENE